MSGQIIQFRSPLILTTTKTMKTTSKTMMTTSCRLLSILVIALALSCSGSDDADVDSTPEQAVGFKGDYSGTWNSTTPSITYTDYPISITIEQERKSGEEITLTGPFYATASQTSCCGSVDDGSVVIKIVDQTITSFTFVDRIVGCTGNFAGSGTIGSNGDLIIEFTGTDCDGDHIGVMRFRK